MASAAIGQQFLTNFYRGLAASAGVSAKGEGESWLNEIDNRTSPTQLRQYLQSDAELRSQTTLRALVERFRNRPDHRHKLDFVVSEYLANFAPQWLQDKHKVTFDDVAKLLEPLLGPVGEQPNWMPQLEEMIEELAAYEHLHELSEHGIFERGRALKTKVSQRALDNYAVIAFARFNYLLRRAFTQLWDADLWWIDQALIELESRAEFFVDCSELEMSPIEPTNELSALVRKWQRPSFSDYANDTTYLRVQTLRNILEAALQPES